MRSRLEKARKRITKEKSAKPKVPKGETPPPAKTTAEITAEVEAEMVELRCEEEQWARNQFERMSRGWAVGRRELVDFHSSPQRAGAL